MSLMAAYTYANLDEDLLRTENQSPAQLRIESVASGASEQRSSRQALYHY